MSKIGNLRPNSAIVSVEWLYEHLNHEDLLVLDASLPKPKTKYEDYPLYGQQIPKARFFDIKKEFSDTNSPLPNTLPTAEAFELAAQQLGIRNNQTIVVYDFIGVHSSPRAWWLLKAMGHESVYVLDGGLPAWEQKGYPLVQKTIANNPNGDFKAQFKPNYFCTADEVAKAITNNSSCIFDARASGRFWGTSPEPRKGLRSGHIPSAVNIPATSLIVDGHLKDKAALSAIFKTHGTNAQTLLFSCGSGITACILALAAHIAGFPHLSVYDGSWTEWGGDLSRPIATQ